MAFARGTTLHCTPLQPLPGCSGTTAATARAASRVAPSTFNPTAAPTPFLTPTAAPTVAPTAGPTFLPGAPAAAPIAQSLDLICRLPHDIPVASHLFSICSQGINTACTSNDVRTLCCQTCFKLLGMNQCVLATDILSCVSGAASRGSQPATIDIGGPCLPQCPPSQCEQSATVNIATMCTPPSSGAAFTCGEAISQQQGNLAAARCHRGMPSTYCCQQQHGMTSTNTKMQLSFDSRDSSLQ